MRIEILTDESAEAYEQFVRARADSLLYHRWKYARLLRDLLGARDHYLLAVEDGVIRGALPLMFTDGPAGRVYNSLPYYGSIGGILADGPEAAGMLRAAYDELVRGADVLAATLVSSPFGPSGLDEQVAHGLTDHRIGQFTVLEGLGDDPGDALMRRIDASARRNVRKAAREGVTVRTDSGQLPRLWEMHRQNILAVGGLPKDRRFFELLGERFEPHTEYDVYVAQLGGKVVAGLLVFYYNGTVEYFTPATDPDYRQAQPMAAILMTAMADSARRPMRRWNWGGTWASQEGVYRFKRKWAAEECRYHYYTRLNDPGILDWAPERILQAYPGFFVVPFAALHAGVTHA